MKKRLVSMFLILAMCMGLTVPAFAAEPAVEKVLAVKIENEIQSQIDEIYNTVYEQLEAQNALNLIDSFMAVYEPTVRCCVMEKYGMLDIASTYANNESISYYFPHGGTLCFTNTQLGSESVSLYLNRADTDKYILNSSSGTIYDLVLEILGHAPVFGFLFETVAKIKSVYDVAAKYNISKADGYSWTLNVYDPATGDSGSVVLGWQNYPTATINASTSSNVEYQVFPSHIS